MDKQMTLRQDEKTLAALAHASILLGIPTSGLVIWIVQKEKSAYVAAQALQALVYQAVTFVLTMIVWCCWGVLYMALIFVPLVSNPGAFEAAPPTGLWVGLGLTILYGLYGAARCLGGHDFKYAAIGNWLDNQN